MYPVYIVLRSGEQETINATNPTDAHRRIENRIKEINEELATERLTRAGFLAIAVIAVIVTLSLAGCIFAIGLYAVLETLRFAFTGTYTWTAIPKLKDRRDSWTARRDSLGASGRGC